jgi:hypothetical protein
VGAARPLDLSEVLLVFEVTGKERDSKEYNWGFDNAFDSPSRQHHRLDKHYWNPVENTEVCCNRLVFNLKILNSVIVDGSESSTKS